MAAPFGTDGNSSMEKGDGDKVEEEGQEDVKEDVNNQVKNIYTS